jgi:hypothetical protein
VLPKAIWLLFTLLAGFADPRWNMFAGWAIVALTAWNVHRLGPGAGFTIVASALLFSPIQQENWLWGAQMMLFLPALFLTTWLRQSASPRFVIWGATLAILATFSFANGFLLWPALFAAVEPEQRRKAALPWTGAFAVTLAIYLFQFERVASSPSYTAILSQPLAAAQYFLSFLGNPLASGNLSRATIAGVILLVALVFLPKQKPWLILAGYALASAGLATVGRAALGPQQALDSRYGAFAVWFGIAVLAMAWEARSAWRGCLISAVVIAHGFSFWHGVQSMHYRALAARYQRACLTFVHALPGGDCVANYPVWSADFLRQASEPLNRASWIRPKLRGPQQAFRAEEIFEGIGNLEALDAGGKWRFQGGVGVDADAIVIAIGNSAAFVPVAMTGAGRTSPLRNTPSAYRVEVDKTAIPAGSRVAAFAYRAEAPQWMRLGATWTAPSAERERVVR